MLAHKGLIFPVWHTSTILWGVKDAVCKFVLYTCPLQLKYLDFKLEFEGQCATMLFVSKCNCPDLMQQVAQRGTSHLLNHL